MEAKKMPELTVWYGSMPETNGKSNWTAILHRKGECISNGITIDRSEYPDRVRYEADRMRYLIGELDIKPSILSYDGSKHSGYVQPVPPSPVLKPIELPPIIRIGYTHDEITVMCNVRNDDIAAIRAAGYEVKI